MKIKLWVKEDWNGFFGLFTNNLTNLLVMASILTLGIGLENDIVFLRILPAVGLNICIASLYYASMAYKLAKKEKRNDVTALPSGTSVPHMFLIVFMVIGPVYWETNDPYIAWGAGVAWSLFEGIIELVGSFIGQKVRNNIPRVAMLGALASVSLTYIALNPAYTIWQVPYIGFVSLTVILLGWFGKVEMPFNIPTGLVAIILGTIIGWISGLMDFGVLAESVSNISFATPKFSFFRIASGIEQAMPFLVAAIPLGIYNFFETIDNVESASVAGDSYSTREAMLADGITTIFGSLMGNPFPTAIFIGHPGWKDTGARIGYVIATGIGVLLITFLGIVTILLNVIPTVAILPILLYIGIVITTQAFTSVDKKYYPAAVIALIPYMADWTRNEIDIALSAAGTNAKDIGLKVMENAGVNYEGMFNLGSGAIITGMLWASITTFIIDGKFKKAAITCVLSAVLSYFGIIHAASVGIAANVDAAIGYGLIMFIFIYYYKTKEKMEEKI